MPDEPFTPTTGQYETDRMVRDWLRKPFKPEQVGKLPATAKRPALDFVGHAAVTDRLNKIAPDWSYTIDEVAGFGIDLAKVWIRGTMTIGGVSRPEFGDGDDPKEAIGNFIRRGAMRFGVAIDLWSREEFESAPSSGHGNSADAGGRVDQASSASRASSEGTTEVLGEGASDPSATPEPGEGSSPFSPSPGKGMTDAERLGPVIAAMNESAAPGKRKYPNAANDGHNHDFTKDGRCRLCGKPATAAQKIAAIEGTVEDLGPAEVSA